MTFMLFSEIQHARLFWLSYRAHDKYAMTFRDITEAFFDYIGRDKEKLKKYASYSRYEGRALEKAFKDGKDIFDILAGEAECLWNDMLPSFAYGEKHDIPTRVFFYEKETTQEGTSHLFTPVQELISGNTRLYKELPKRSFLERLGIAKEDTIGTPYEYLFDNEIEQLLSNDHMDFDWKWIAEQGG